MASPDRHGYLAVGVLLPVIGASLGVNGGNIFQILAKENLGLDSRQIGLAVGLGAISVPFQIWAARMPLRLARRNLRTFFSILTLLCWLLAWLVPGPIATSATIVIVIAVAVLAELALSILFATSWQPLLSLHVSGAYRQRLNAQARAAGSVVSITVVFVVGLLGAGGRVLVLVAIGFVALFLVRIVGTLPGGAPDGVAEAVAEADGFADAGVVAVPPVPPVDGGAGSALLPLYIVASLVAAPAWAFFVTYAADVLWPTANLGLIGAAFAVGWLLAAGGWRPTDHHLVRRARISAAVLVACASAMIAVDHPVSGGFVGVVVLIVVATSSAALSTIRMALLELVHQRTTVRTSVRVLTTLDVVGSTSMQVWFLAAGFLISFSVGSTWPVDPYLLSLLVTPLLLLLALGPGLAQRADLPG